MSLKNRLVVHTLVRNEARWIWFALNSVLDIADEIMVWDTGSTDSTPEIIKSINSPKIKFKQIGPVDAIGHSHARQSMLDETQSDWILILDGDEIWYHQSLLACNELITHNPSLSALISPFINLIGDIYHYQDSARNKYQIGSLKGAYNIRFINRHIPGLHLSNPHGRQEYRDAKNIPLQNYPEDKLQLVKAPYLHTTHLPRSANRNSDINTLKRDFKYRYELGNSFASDFIYPESFYLPRPAIVPNPWFRRTPGFVLKSMIYEPLRIIKNQFSPSNSKGY